MIQTVLGPIEAKDVKGVLPHEHILSDLRPLVSPLDNGIFYQPVSLQNRGALSRNPYAVLDNALLDDREAATEEFRRLAAMGFNLVADATTGDFGRDPLFLRELSRKTGVHLVAGCGFYLESAVKKELRECSVSQLYEILLKELTEGIGDTGIRAGMIGEIGSGFSVGEAEKKYLQAAALAQRETGFGMHIHACLWNREGLKALELALSHGADPEKLCVDHADVLLDEDYILGILSRGAYVEFDNFGKEYYVDRKNRNLLCGSFAHDTRRVQMLKKLIDRGYGKQLLISNDICLKSMLHAYGGWGYDHIGENIVSMMEDFGICQEDIRLLLHGNPIRFLERKEQA